MATMNFGAKQVRQADAVQEKEQIANYDASPPSIRHDPSRQSRAKAVCAPSGDLANPVLCVFPHIPILQKLNAVVLPFVMNGLIR
jgi:hypothetical protein